MTDDRDRGEAGGSVEVTDGLRQDDASFADGVPFTSPGVSRPPQPVLGAALRPPLTGSGRSARPLVGDVLREALASHPAPPPPAPPTDRYTADEGYPPSPYRCGGPKGEPYLSVTSVLPPVPSPASAAVADVDEQELWFHPRVEPASALEPLAGTEPSSGTKLPAGTEPPSGTKPPVGTEPPAVHLPPAPTTLLQATPVVPQAMPADPSTIAIVLPPAESLPGAVRPEPRDMSAVALADDRTVTSVRPMSRRARRAAEHAGECSVPASPVPLPSSPVRESLPSLEPSLRLAEDALAESGPGLSETTQRTRPRRTGGGGASMTSSIPVIRPPVQVRRPDEDPAETAETQSLRAAVPGAEALFRTPAGPKGTQPVRGDALGDGRSSSLPSSANVVPSSANVVPPSPAVAPPLPVAPKNQRDGDPFVDDGGSGRSRGVVIISGAGSESPTTGPLAPAVQPSASTGPAPGGERAASDPTAQWLGQLRGDGTPLGEGAPRSGEGMVGSVPAGETVVPVRGREVKQNRKVAERTRKADEGARKRGKRGRKAAIGSADETTPWQGRGVDDPNNAAARPDAPWNTDFDDFDGLGRGRLLSLLVFWAPALILLLLAGVVIWLVR